MCCTRSVASNTVVIRPRFDDATASRNIRSRSSWKQIACSKNTFSSTTRLFSAQVSSASPSVANLPCFFAR